MNEDKTIAVRRYLDGQEMPIASAFGDRLRIEGPMVATFEQNRLNSIIYRDGRNKGRIEVSLVTP